MNTRLKSILVFLFIFFFFTGVAYAADPPCPSGFVCTGIGPIPTDATGLANALLKIALGVAGGLAFLLIIYGGFRLALSQGDPKAIQEARDIITSAIVGLLLIILSTFILRLIGIDIFGLPI